MGWSVGSRDPREEDDAVVAAEIYDKLERDILPLYHDRPDAWMDVMRSAIAVNGSYFSTQRMLQEYIASAYASLVTT